tara:strand:+ start:485 stop:865 length:381 start_codon:yes stop_codon:yes gene_type:complete
MKNEKYEGTDKLIEVGDNVMYGYEVDKIIEVKSYDNCYNNYILESGGYVEGHNLAIKPHKYRDVFNALANGLEVEVKCLNEWHTMCLNGEYRIKPTVPSKSPKQLEKERIQKEMEKLAKDLEALDV